MTTVRTAQVNAPAAAGLVYIIFKFLDTVNHDVYPSIPEAGESAMIGFRWTGRLSWNNFIQMLTEAPGILFGSAQVVTLPNDISAVGILDAVALADTIELSSFRFFFSQPEMFTNMLESCASVKSGEHVGGIYDPETLGGLTGGAKEKTWP